MTTTRYEVKRVVSTLIPEWEIAALLNEGWEVIAFAYDTQVHCAVMYFKRPIQ